MSNTDGQLITAFQVYKNVGEMINDQSTAEINSARTMEI